MRSSRSRSPVVRAPFALSLILLAVGCGDDPASGTGGGGDGGSAPSTSAGDGGATSATTTTSAASTTTATTGAGTCTPTAGDACEACVADTCCDAWTACEADALCWACVTGEDGSGCDASADTHARVTAYLECIGGPCNEACIGATGACTEAVDVFADDCGTCLEQSCCDEVGACFAHEGCWVDCVTDHDSEGCHEPTAHALFYAMGACAQESCAAACAADPVELACEGVPEVAPSGGACVTIGGDVACNPVTNEGCEDGSACDAAEEGFTCYPPPNEVALCEPCGEAEGWCAPGHVCIGGGCARWCCDDADCGPQGTCDTSVGDGVGACVAGG